MNDDFLINLFQGKHWREERRKGRTHLFILWENKLPQLETKDFEATERVVTFPRGRCG